MRKKDCRQLKKELLCKGEIAESGLQVLHVHVLLVTSLGACDMAQAGADEHQGGVAVREGTHNSEMCIRDSCFTATKPTCPMES